MKKTDIPTHLLRTLVTLLEVRSFTKAAELAGVSQPSVSLQMKRLESIVGDKLVEYKNHKFVVSEQAEALAVYARQILRLNEQAIGLFKTGESGRIRVGLPLDYAVRLQQAGLADLMREHEGLKLSIQCDLSRTLLDAIASGEIDIAVALYPGGDPQFIEHRWKEQPVWVGAETAQPDSSESLPLVAHPSGCVYRQRMTEALSTAHRNWEVVFSTPDIEALQQAVIDGFGFTSLTAPTTLPGMRRFSQSDGMPQLEPLQIGLFYHRSRLGEDGKLVAEKLIKTIDGVPRAGMQDRTSAPAPA